MMRGGPAAVPPQRPPNQGAWGNQQRVQQVAAPWAQQAPLPGAMPVGGANPGWYQQQPPPGMQQGPPGQNPAWYQPQQPGMPPGGQNPPWAQQNAPGAAPMPMPGQTRLGTSLKPLGSLAIRSSPMAREWRPG